MIEAGANALAERGGRPILRGAHAKGHGCVAATFTFTTDAAVAPDLKKGVFAEVRSYPAWIRFSNGSPMPEEDRIGDVRGMAIKLVGVPGPKLLADESDAVTQDFVLVDFPRFFLRDALEYVPFTKPDQKAVLDAMEGRSVAHLFAQRYFSMTPSLLGERPVKLGARPVACEVDAGSGARPAESDPNDLRAGMRTWLEARDACFRFTVQPQAD